MSSVGKKTLFCNSNLNTRAIKKTTILIVQKRSTSTLQLDYRKLSANEGRTNVKLEADVFKKDILCFNFKFRFHVLFIQSLTPFCILFVKNH